MAAMTSCLCLNVLNLNWPIVWIHNSWVPFFNTLRPRQNGHHFADDIFKCILLNENVWITIKNSLKFVPKGLINNIPALVQVMAWRRPGDKPLSEPMLISLPTHICITRPQWVNESDQWQYFIYYESLRMASWLTHLPMDKMAAVSQTIFSDAFSWMKIFVFRLKFLCSLLLRVQLHWFR